MNNTGQNFELPSNPSQWDTEEEGRKIKQARFEERRQELLRAGIRRMLIRLIILAILFGAVWLFTKEPTQPSEEPTIPLDSPAPAITPNALVAERS